MKPCTKCNQVKELTEFHKNRSKRDGYSSECKICSLKYRQTEKGKAMHKRHRQTAKYKATRKQYLIHHPEYIKAKDVVRNAVKSKKLPHADTLRCHYCPAKAEQYHHWHGYEPEHWLDVIPACKKCHYKCRRKKIA